MVTKEDQANHQSFVTTMQLGGLYLKIHMTHLAKDHQKKLICTSLSS